MMYLKLSVFYVYGEILLFSTELCFLQVISKRITIPMPEVCKGF